MEGPQALPVDRSALAPLHQAQVKALVADLRARIDAEPDVAEPGLDRTLDPAIDTFGLAATTAIDPTGGLGHLLLGSFHRLRAQWWRVDGFPVVGLSDLDSRRPQE